MVAHAARQDEVWLVRLDPTRWAEMQKTRPCLIVSPDELNENLQTVIIAPMTTVVRHYPTRIPVQFQNKDGQIALDQLRAVDSQRLTRRLGMVAASTGAAVADRLVEMFRRL